MIEVLNSLENGIGLEISAWFNQLGSPVLQILLSPFHYLGSEIGFLILLPSIYWAFDKDFGRRTTIMLLGAQYFSLGLKNAFSRSRPFQVAPERFHPISEYSEPGLPSGHTISGTVIGLAFLRRSRHRASKLLWILFILLMGISRLVHGVHYPQDVLAGWLVGILWFLAYHPLERLILRIVDAWGSSRKFLVTGGLSLAAITLIIALPLEWKTAKDFLSITAILAGAIIGIIAESRAGLFDTENLSTRTRLFRIIVGLLSLFAIYALLNFAYYAVVGDSHATWTQFLYFVRYGLVGCWATLGSPWLFTRRVDSRKIRT